MRITNIGVAVLCCLGFMSCQSQKITQMAPQAMAGGSPRPGVRVFRLSDTCPQADAVPVGLNEDGSRILSYPAPGDLLRAGALRRPQALGKGYWLDNMGVGTQTGLLKWTFQEYAAFRELPSLPEMKAALACQQPFAELYDCGQIPVDEAGIKTLRKWIRQKQLAQKARRLL